MVDFSWNAYYEKTFDFYDKRLLDLVQSNDDLTNEFFKNLALCHTVMPEVKDGNLEYQAQSPDENALVSAARNFGFVFKVRSWPLFVIGEFWLCIHCKRLTIVCYWGILALYSL